MSAVREAGEFQKIFNHAYIKLYNIYSQHIFNYTQNYRFVWSFGLSVQGKRI